MKSGLKAIRTSSDGEQPMAVTTTAAMKSGLKDPRIKNISMCTRQSSNNHCRDEKRTESLPNDFQTQAQANVTTTAAMKSGLKVQICENRLQIFNRNNHCRDEKRTERM